MNNIYRHLYDLIKAGEPSVIATILDKSGSAPREEGTQMLIRKNFSISGTIGGGILEALTIKASSSVFENREFAIKNFTLTNKDASSIGMICGGNVNILLEYVDPMDSAAREIYSKIHELKNKNLDFVLITKLSKSNPFSTGKDKWICTETAFHGSEDENVQHIARKIREDFENVKVEFIDGNDRYLVTPFYNNERVCIIGAGHVALQVVDFIKNLGFYTVVVDDREEFANYERFPYAKEIRIIPAFENLAQKVEINHNTYVAILTRGHSYDKDVLAQMLRTKAKYIGMIGSKSKRDHTYSQLLKEGFTKKDMDRVYSPIGIDIKAQTPEEIAVSIVAEIIKVKRGMGDHER